MTDPWAFQADGVAHLRSHPRDFLGDEPGLGKSRQLLLASEGDTLVIAPAMVLDGGTWTDEAEKWADRPIWTAPYSGLNTRERTGKGTGSRPTLNVQPAFDRAWGTLILDECHYVKNKKTSWTFAVRKIAKKAERLYLATGTPIPNWPHELFVPLQLLYPEEASPGKRFGAYWRWAEEWFRVLPNQFRPFEKDILGLRRCGSACNNRPPWDPCDHYHEFVAANLGDRFIRRLRDDVLKDLPPLTQQTIKVPMTAKQTAEYRRMAKNYMIMVDEQERVAWSAGSRQVMLDLITTGLGLLSESPTSVESGKFKRLELDLSSRSRPTLVVAHYQSSVETAAQVARTTGATAAVIHGGTSKAERLKRVRAFQTGQLDVLCGSLETISEGLTLTAADMVIFVEKSFKPSRNEQALRRIHRIGQTRPCTALDYVSVTPKGGRTVDGNKRELLARKNDLQMRTMTAAMFAGML